MSPAPGTLLAGKYLVEAVLGVGGMGAVVAARHVQLDQRVAIKYLLPEALANAEVVARFSREARTCAKIRGEHVARVIDVSQFDDGTPFMVLEYLEGRDLAAELDAIGPLQLQDVVRYMLEACEALAEAHAAGVVHRDLKPANLFLAIQPDRRAIVKVLDFGISRSVDPGAAALTGTMSVMGTPYYISPEQLTNPKGIDHRADIWSLGVILFELLTNERPFKGESVPHVITSILHGQPTPIRTVWPDVPPGVEAIIRRCLRGNAHERYRDVGDLAEALAPFASPKDRESVETISRVLGGPARSALASTVGPTGASAFGHSPSGTEILPVRPASNSGLTAPAWAHSLPDAKAALSAEQAVGDAPTTRPRRAAWLISVGAVIAVVGIGAGLFKAGKHQASTGSAPTSPDRPPEQSSSTEAKAPASLASSASPALALLPLAETKSIPSAAPTALSAPRKPAPHSAAPSATAPPSRPPSSAAVNPKCAEKYYYDPDGQRHLKPECFAN